MAGCVRERLPQPSPVGLKALERIEALPYLTPAVRSYMFSTHDRTGGNDDGFSGTYSSLYRDETGYVLFDAYGPGCLYRIQSALRVGNLRFYFDDESAPRIDMSQENFFSGKVYPLIFPLVGDAKRSSGGYYSYLPFPFRKRLKISSTTPQFYYQFSYHLLPEGTDVETYTGQEDLSGVLRQWNTIGEDPKKDRGVLFSAGNVLIGPGEVKTLTSVSSGGSLSSIRIAASTADPRALRRIILRMYWDGEESPSVSAPLWDLFGAGARSLLFGQDAGGWFYSYFPMPFWSSARIEAENTHTEGVALDYEIRRGAPYSMDAGYFHALWREENPTSPGKDYTVLDEQGRGTFVGTSASMQGVDAGIFTQCTSTMGMTSDLCFLEGDERVYADGSLSPDIYGTGTEDYFNGAWYFMYGTFSLPLHGHPTRPQDAVTQINAYRIHLGDSIPFESSLRFLREVGPGNDVTARYSSVAYYYLREGGGLVLTDDLDVGDADSESGHAYMSEGSLLTNLTSRYEGAQDTPSFHDSGRTIPSQSVFVLRIDPKNTGVRLRVRKDMGSGIQKARVFVAGTFAGTWYIPETNPYLRWRDADLEIPGALTRNKGSITLRIENAGDDGWNEYHYWVYSRLK